METESERKPLGEVKASRSNSRLPAPRSQSVAASKRVLSDKESASPDAPASKKAKQATVPARGTAAAGRAGLSKTMTATSGAGKPAPTPRTGKTGKMSRPTTAATARTGGASSASTRPGTATGKTGSRAAGTSTTGAAARKRPEWDVKGRLADMESLNESLKDKMKETITQVEELRGKLQESGEKVQELDVVKEIESELRSELATSQQQVASLTVEKEAFMSQVQALTASVTRLEGENDSLKNEVAAKDQSIKGLELELKQQKLQAETELATVRNSLTMEMQSMRMSLQEQLESTKTKLSCAEELAADRAARIAQLESEVANHLGTIDELEQKRRADEIVRRRLHNTIQELKGNIRVFCRVRPPLASESELSQIEFPVDEDGNGEIKSIQLFGEDQISATGQSRGAKEFRFDFDKVFPPQASQQDVFEEVSQLVQSALDGYHVCVFAYGVTGSGKTFTMEGMSESVVGSPGSSSSSNPDMILGDGVEGVIPRTVQQIFHASKSLEDQGWEYTLSASFLEIYNETIRDLLAEPGTNLKYDIKHDREGHVSVSNIIQHEVSDPGQVHELLHRASRQRAWAATNCNAHSSRSHSVFQLFLNGRNKLSGKTSQGVLNLIDLAGSERLKKTQHTGDRKLETQHINKSLSCLGDVIAALANKSSHIPYRNSKLTHLLQDSLGGNSKTLMFVNISPNQEQLSESISSLRFAAKVNACEIGTARRKGGVDFNTSSK